MTNGDLSTPKKGGRRAETPMQRLERLTRDYEAAKQQVREHQQRTFAAIGAALVAEAKDQPDVMKLVREIAARRVTAKGTMADIDSMLGG